MHAWGGIENSTWRHKCTKKLDVLVERANAEGRDRIFEIVQKSKRKEMFIHIQEEKSLCRRGEEIKGGFKLGERKRRRSEAADHSYDGERSAVLKIKNKKRSKS